MTPPTCVSPVISLVNQPISFRHTSCPILMEAVGWPSQHRRNETNNTQKVMLRIRAYRERFALDAERQPGAPDRRVPA